METVVYHGMGYVGLVGAVHYALNGVPVVGYDVDKNVVTGINQGNPRCEEFLTYLNPDVKAMVQSGMLRATSNFQELSQYKIHIVAVPTESNGHAYMSIAETVIANLHACLTPGSIIIIESTVTPGFTDDLVKKYKDLGTKLHFAVAPRRDWFADASKNIVNLTRVVGGLTSECTKYAIEVLSQVSKHIEATDYRTAELCKSIENGLFHVQIMYALQLANAYPDRNMAEAIRLAGTHWRLTPLHLSFGTGGRCVPLGNQYLLNGMNNKFNFTLAKDAVEFDKKHREIIAAWAYDNTPIEGSVLVMGIGYREDFKDAGLSPGLHIARMIKEKGVDVYVNDPMWSPSELEKLTELTYGSLHNRYDTILLATPHTEYKKLPEEGPFGGPASLFRIGQYILDGTGAWSKYRSSFEQRKINYTIVGEEGWNRAESR